MLSLWTPQTLAYWQSLLAMLAGAAEDTEVTVRWAEPAMSGDQFLTDAAGCIVWRHFEQRGVATRLATWASRHIDYWMPKAYVPLQIVRMEYKPEGVCPGW